MVLGSIPNGAGTMVLLFSVLLYSHTQSILSINFFQTFPHPNQIITHYISKMQLRNGKSLSTHSDASTRPSYSHLSKIIKLRRGNEEKSQHNASSLLLKLPPEIKMMIYGYVCGHQTIHIYRTEKPTPGVIHMRATQGWRVERSTKPVVVKKANQLIHTVCSESVSEEAEQQIFDSPSAAWNNKSNKSPHRYCVFKDPVNTPPFGGWADPTPQLDFSFLHTCRQIYDEAILVPYKTNVFSFKDSKALTKFTQTPYMSSIRRLRLEINIGVEREREPYIPPWDDAKVLDTSLFSAWKQSLNRVTSQMTTLQYVHLDVEQDCYRKPPFSQKVEVGGRDEVAEGLLILANLPLRGVTVTLRDEYDGSFDEGSDEDVGDEFDQAADERSGRWTMVQRQRWATAVRDGLLG